LFSVIATFADFMIATASSLSSANRSHNI